eukprot:1140908-Pyramimonas_sp.AAC.1
MAAAVQPEPGTAQWRALHDEPSPPRAAPPTGVQLRDALVEGGDGHSAAIDCDELVEGGDVQRSASIDCNALAKGGD